MKDGLGQLDMTKMSGTFGEIAGARLTTRGPIDDTLPWIHQAAQLRPSILINFRKLDAALGNGHAANLVGRQNTELDPFRVPNGRFRVRRDYRRHLCRLLCAVEAHND